MSESIPENHDKLREISEVIAEGISENIELGGSYYDERSAHIAAWAIRNIMPEPFEYQNSQIAIRSEIGVSVNSSKKSATFDNLIVKAHFERVSIQGIISTLGEGESALSMKSFDLCAVLMPEFINPYPEEIAFAEKLYIPFKNVSLFEPVN